MLNDFNFEDKKKKINFKVGRILGRIFKNSFKAEISTDTEEEFNKKNNEETENAPSKNINLYDKYSTIDRSPLSKNTLALIEIFENVPKKSKISKMGGNFEFEGAFIEKLSRYECFINFLIDNSKGEKLPSVKFIMKNFEYGDEKLSSDKLVRTMKEEGGEIGDLYQKITNGAYFLKRTEKY